MTILIGLLCTLSFKFSLNSVAPYTGWGIFSRTSCWVTEYCCTSWVSWDLLFVHLSIFFLFPSVASVIWYYLDTSLLICPTVSPRIYTDDYFCLCVKHGTWLYETASYLIFPPLCLSNLPGFCPSRFEVFCEFKSLLATPSSRSLMENTEWYCILDITQGILLTPSFLFVKSWH